MLRDLGLTPNQVWGLTKTGDEWSAALKVALTATRRNDLKHVGIKEGPGLSIRRGNLATGSNGDFVLEQGVLLVTDAPACSW